jgi:hypothetical protein
LELNTTYSFSAGSITVLEPDVLLVKYQSKKRITVQEMKDSSALREELIGNTRYYPVIDCTDGIVNFSPEAKSWIAANKESLDVRIMDILIISNWALRMEVKLYIKFFEPKNETRVVHDLAEALELVNLHKKQESEKSVRL